MNYDTVLCVDLRSFDNTIDDYGVDAYFSHVGFVPTEICFLNFQVMFLFGFDGVDDTVLDPICTGQNGTPCTRQWTVRQLAGLVSCLHGHGVRCYLGILANTTSPVWRNTRTSWEHEEVLQRTRGDRLLWGSSINVLKHMADGTLFEDVFIDRLVTAILALGMDGYVAGDGMLGLRGPRETLADTDYSSDMVDQFRCWSALNVPDLSTYDERADYIQKYMKDEWVGFWVWRWTVHARKLSSALRSHGLGFQAIDAWSRNPIEARSSFGIDYRALYEAGLEGLFVQARETNKWRKHREGEYVREENSVFTFLSHKAYEPRLRYYWAQATVNIPEFWNSMLDLPNVIQRESHAYLWSHCLRDGVWSRCIDGICVIWANDLGRDDWKRIRDNWDAACSMSDRFSGPLGLTLLFDDVEVSGGDIMEASRFAALLDNGVLVHSAVPAREGLSRDDVRAYVTFSRQTYGSCTPQVRDVTFLVEDGCIEYRGVRYSFHEGVELMKRTGGIRSTSGRVFGFSCARDEIVLSLENPGNLFYEKVYFAIDRRIGSVRALPPRQWYSMPHSIMDGSAAVSLPPDAALQLEVQLEGTDSVPLAFNILELGV